MCILSHMLCLSHAAYSQGGRVMLIIAMVVQMLLCGPMSFTLTDEPLVLDDRFLRQYEPCVMYCDVEDFAQEGDDNAMP